jgi:hypothetical protein
MHLGAWIEQSRCKPVVVASHPRSGTHLLIDALRLNFPDCRSWKWWGERKDRLYLNLASLSRGELVLTERKAIQILRRSRMPLIKTHTTADMSHDVVDGAIGKGPATDLACWLNQNAVMLYTYRDGRNALCSFYEMERRRISSANVPFSDFIRQCPHGISRVREWAQHVRGWMDRADVFCVAMEELLAYPEICLPAIAEKLGLSLDSAGCRLPRRSRNITHGRLQRLLAIRPHSTAILNPGGATNWRRFFTPEDREFFERESSEMLIKLGYAEDRDWTNPANDEVQRQPIGFFAATRGIPRQSKEAVIVTTPCVADWQSSPDPDRADSMSAVGAHVSH